MNQSDESNESKTGDLALAKSSVSALYKRTQLPTLFALKNEVNKLITVRIRSGVRERLPMMQLSPMHIMHDAGKSSVRRGDGTMDDTTIFAHTAEHTTAIKEHSHFDLRKFDEAIESLAEQFGKSMAEKFFEFMNDTTSRTGQTIDGTNKPFQEAVLDALEMLPATSEDDDSPVMIVSPQIAEKIQQLQAGPPDPELDRRFREINERKRAERLAREAGRKLVG